MFVNEWFDKADLNGDKYLSFDESKNILPKINYLLKSSGNVKLTKAQLLNAWNQVDINRDNQIDMDEFKASVVKFFNEYSKNKKLDLRSIGGL